MENFGKFTTVVLTLIAAPLINSFVFIKLWSWFIVPTFNMNELRIIEAIGIMFLISFIKAKRSKEETKNDFWSDLPKNIAYLIINAGFALFFGWIASLFM